jgi:hypothetical protein
VAIPIPQIPPLPPAGSYEILDLRRFDFDDYHPLLLHMTGRGSTQTDCDDPVIAAATPLARLAGILGDGRLRAFRMFGTGVRAACFTENSPSALNWLISTGRHVPWGVAFSKDLVFRQGGGPVIEVRGDDWPATEFWPDELLARVKRLWPGVRSADPATIPWYLTKVSEWSFEREWRLPLNDLRFEPTDVAFVICASEEWFAELLKMVESKSPRMAQRLVEVPHLLWDPVRNRLVP